MAKKLNQDFYDAPTLDVARALIGKYLVRRGPDGPVVGQIVETEAYCGPDDQASHARWGPTRRAAIMFGPPGYWYVYVIYGFWNCLNVTTERDGYPAAILLRAVVPVSGIPEGLKTDGPGKLCRAFGIDRTLNTQPAFGPGAEAWIEDRGAVVPPEDIRATPRINIPYAGEYKDKPWRFVLDRAASAR
jgi:DNA-3-methyladenine glycosylase